MFKGLRKFYKNNRIYCILMIISMFCLLLMGTSVIIYFVNQSNSSPYGNRLDDIDDYELGDTLESIDKFYKESEIVKSVEARLQGKIIYISADVDEKTSNEDIQNLATSSLDKIDNELKSYYDIQFLFTRGSYPAYFGSKAASKTVITWANYSFDNEDTTTTAKK